MKLMRDMSPEERRAMRERFGEDEEMREAMDPILQLEDNCPGGSMCQ